MLFHSHRYNTDLASFGVNKPFALDRGELVLKALRDEMIDVSVHEPEPITLADAALVHTPEYIESLKEPATWLQIMELGEEDYFPERASRPLPELIEDILLKSGGTVSACKQALNSRLAANLGGGYHHAFPGMGRGFCVLHDIAIAIRMLQREKLIKTATVVDLDFHQGDGTAVIFENDASVFTFSVHSREGWPEDKQESSLDIALGEYEAQQEYQVKLEKGLEEAFSQLTPDLCIFVAGSDPYELDVLPGTRFMKLTLDQLRTRDEFVIDSCVWRNIPLAMVFAGGYGPHVWRVHHNAVRHLVQRSGITGSGTRRDAVSS